jgi:hypothetical protein
MKKITVLFLLAVCARLHAQTGAALFFDGSNDYVSLPNTNTVFNVTATHQKTVQFWFRNTAGQGNDVRIFSTGSATWSTGMWIGYAASSNSLRLEVSDGMGTSGVAVNGSTNIRGDNTYHHAAAVLNGTLATLYLDAAVEATLNISSEGAIASAGSVHIGNSYNNEVNSYFEGNVDELRVWNRALCQDEIAATKNCELAGNETGLVAYYRFNQGTANGNNAGLVTLNDATSNGNHGTLNNFALSTAVSNWYSPGGVVTGSACAIFNPPVLGVQGNGNTIANGNYTPVPGNHTDLGTMCPGATVTRTFMITNSGAGVMSVSGIVPSGTNAGMYSVTPTTFTINPSASLVFTVVHTPTISGNTTVHISILSNDCGANPYVFALSASVMPAPVPTPTIAPVCQGEPLVLTGPAASSHMWIGPASFMSSSQSPTINPANPSHAGVYSLSVTYSNGCQRSAVGQATVYPLMIPVVSTPSLCSGASATLAAFGSGTLSWFGPNGFSAGGQLVLIPNAAPAVSGVYTVVSVAPGNCSASVQSTLAVHPTPTLVVSGATVCAGETATVSASGAQFYAWSGPNGFSSTQATVILPATNSLTTGSYVVLGASAAGCTASATASLVVKPVPVLIVPQVAQVCAGNAVIIAPSGGSSYFWEGPNSYTSTATTLSFATASSSLAGIYSVTAFNTAGCSTMSQVYVTVLSFSFDVGTSNAMPCAGNKVVLSVTPTGQLAFMWDPIAMAGTQVTVIPVSQMTYTITGLHVSGCVVTRTFTQGVSECLGIADSEPDRAPVFYPNPSAGILYMKSEKTGLLSILGATGAVLKEFAVPSGSSAFDLGDLPPGLYTAVVTDGCRHATSRLIIE